MFQTRLKWKGWELKGAHTLARQGELHHSAFGWMLGVKNMTQGKNWPSRCWMFLKSPALICLLSKSFHKSSHISFCTKNNCLWDKMSVLWIQGVIQVRQRRLLDPLQGQIFPRLHSNLEHCLNALCLWRKRVSCSGSWQKKENIMLNCSLRDPTVLNELYFNLYKESGWKMKNRCHYY